jgi:hypothetical protein
VGCSPAEPSRTNARTLTVALRFASTFAVLIDSACPRRTATLTVQVVAMRQVDPSRMLFPNLVITSGRANMGEDCNMRLRKKTRLRPHRQPSLNRAARRNAAVPGGGASSYPFPNPSTHVAATVRKPTTRPFHTCYLYGPESRTNCRDRPAAIPFPSPPTPVIGTDI